MPSAAVEVMRPVAAMPADLLLVDLLPTALPATPAALALSVGHALARVTVRVPSHPVLTPANPSIHETTIADSIIPA